MGGRDVGGCRGTGKSLAKTKELSHCIKEALKKLKGTGSF